MSIHINSVKLTDEEISERALALPNPRLSSEEKETLLDLPSLQRRKSFRERCARGQAISYLEARYYVRNLLTYGKWLLAYYVVDGFHCNLFFDTKDAAFAEAEELKARSHWVPEEIKIFGPAGAVFRPRGKAVFHFIKPRNHKRIR